ncbi:MAG: hypothetical protein U0636_00115 [Phycisphaerales bacterium]
MLPLKARRIADQVLGKCQIGCGIAVAAFGGVLKADPSQHDPWLAATIQWMQSQAWIVAIAGPIVVGLLQWSRKKYGDPRTWLQVQEVLDDFREDLFGSLDGDVLDHHRVTLFKHCWCHRRCFGMRWPWQWFNRLIPVARSGHLTKDGISTFWAPDSADQSEGIAGAAYRRRQWLVVTLATADLEAARNDLSTEAIGRIAAATHSSPRWVRDRVKSGKYLSGAYAAIAVRVEWDPWGVIVVDSRSPIEIDRAKLDRFKDHARRLTPLLEKI